MELFTEEVKVIKQEIGRLQAELEEYEQIERKISDSLLIMKELAESSTSIAEKLKTAIVSIFPEKEKRLESVTALTQVPSVQALSVSPSEVNGNGKSTTAVLEKPKTEPLLPTVEVTPDASQSSDNNESSPVVTVNPVTKGDFVRVLSEPKNPPGKQVDATGKIGYVDSVNSSFPDAPIMVHLSNGTGFYSSSDLEIVSQDDVPDESKTVFKRKNANLFKEEEKEEEKPGTDIIAVSTNGVTNTLLKPKEGTASTACIGFKTKTKDNGAMAWQEFLTVKYPKLITKIEAAKDSDHNPYEDNSPRYLLWVSNLEGSLPEKVFTYDFAVSTEAVIKQQKKAAEPTKQFKVGESVRLLDPVWLGKFATVISYVGWDSDENSWEVAVDLEMGGEVSRMHFIESDLESNELDF